MQVTKTAIPEVLLIEPKVFGDPRGFFFESFNERVWREQTRVTLPFVQDNHSRSARGVLRGLHFQLRQTQGKLLRVVAGEIFDVAVDMRRSSATFGRWVGEHLSADNKRMLWIPPGFAHGFLVLSESADCLYKATDYYAPAHEFTLAWNDPDVGIVWPLAAAKIEAPVLSAKDKLGHSFKDAPAFA